MGKTYNSNKLILVSNRTTKNQLAEQVAKLVTEVADIMVERNNLRIENEKLKEAVVEEFQEKYHLSIQLQVAEEKIEVLKHNNRNLAINHEYDAMRYALAGNDIFRTRYNCKSVVTSVVAEPKSKTFLQRIFDYFQI